MGISSINAAFSDRTPARDENTVLLTLIPHAHVETNSDSVTKTPVPESNAAWAVRKHLSISRRNIY
jgi:hypothetical protein